MNAEVLCKCPSDQRLGILVIHNGCEKQLLLLSEVAQQGSKVEVDEVTCGSTTLLVVTH